MMMITSAAKYFIVFSPRCQTTSLPTTSLIRTHSPATRDTKTYFSTRPKVGRWRHDFLACFHINVLNQNNSSSSGGSAVVVIVVVWVYTKTAQNQNGPDQTEMVYLSADSHPSK